IISTNYDKISLGNYSTEFFEVLGANKTSNGSWVVPNPVDIIFNLVTVSGLIIGVTIPSDSTCNMIQGLCISIFDDSPGPLNSTNSIILVNKRESIIGIADRNNFCPIPTPTGMPPVPSQTTILPQPTQTFPPPQILYLSRFKTDNQSNQSQSLEYLFQVQIGSNSAQTLNIMPDTCINDIGVCSELCNQSITGSCNNRHHIFDSKNSSSFSQNSTTGSINYLDGSSAKGLFGNDFIILDNFGFANKFSFLLFSQINGILQAESAVEGIMGLGLSSQIWNQLTSNGYDQAIGFALPNSVCDFGSIAFGGIDQRFNNKLFNVDSNEIFSIPTLNDSTYPKIKIDAIWVNETPLEFPIKDAIISTNYDKISLGNGNFSKEFFKILGATKLKDGSWLVSNPVDILFNLATGSGEVVEAKIPSNLTCNIINEKCISIFDDLPGPLNSINSIILGKPFIQ
ncbi:24043_t:CDS:2, partial [Gigaspora rosea]